MSPENTLQPDPRETSNPTATLADKLVLRFSAMRDFQQAKDVIGTMPDDNYQKASELLHLATAEAASGINPTPLLEGVSDLTERYWINKRYFRKAFYRRIARIYADIGDFPNADAALENAKEDSPYTHLHIAKSAIRHDVDPVHWIDRARQIVEEKERSSSPEDVEHARYISGVEHGAIARTLFGIGKDPSLFLEIVLGKVMESGAYSDRAYKNAAETFATCGKFATALRLAKEITCEFQDQTNKFRREAIGYIVKEKLRHGDIEGAIEIGEQIGDQSFWVTFFGIGLYSYIAREHARVGKDPSSVLMLAQQFMPDLKTPTTAYACHLKIAEALAVSGLDALPSFKASLHAAGATFPKGVVDNEENALAIEETQERWAEIAGVAAKNGYLEFARDISERFDGGDCLKARILVELAKIEATRGLSLYQIDSLSKEQIQAMLGRDNELTKQAVLYFGLDKKTLQ